MSWFRFLTALLVAAVTVLSSPFVGDTHRLSAGEEIEPPELLYEEQADYTDEALEAGVEGEVKLELEIDDEGTVTDVEVVDGLGYGLDEAAADAAENFHFRPAMHQGEPIPVVIDFITRFSLPTRPATFEGSVADAETDQPVADADISIEYVGDEHDPPPAAETTTDEEGTFFFRQVPPGEYEVELRAGEYEGADTQIELGDGDILEAEYALIPEVDEDVEHRGVENVAGEVREAGTRSPIAGMHVVLREPDGDEEVVREDYTGGDGRFGFRGVDSGTWVLQVEGSGYSTERYVLEVVDDEITTGNFYLRPDDGGLRLRTTERRERSEVDRQTIGMEETRRMAGAGTDAVRVVENLPGVARQNYFSGQPAVRGAAPEDTQIFLGGDNIPLAFHFLGGPAVVNTEMIDAVDFYPGNFSARYGRATAGIIDMQTRSPKDDRFHGSVEADLLDTSAVVEGPVGDRFSFALSGRRSYYDLFLPMVLEQFDTDVMVSPRYYDYQGWGTYRSEDGNHLVELFLYGSDDQLEVMWPDDEPAGDVDVQFTSANFDNSFHRGQLRWEYDDDRLPVSSRLMTSFGRNSLGVGVAENLYFDLDFYTHQLRWDTNWELADNLELQSGLDSQIGPVYYDFGIPQFDSGPDDGGPNIDITGSDRRSTWQIEPAAYVQLDWELFDRWTLIPGVRADYFHDVSSTSVSPRFSTRFGLTDELTAKGGVGLFTQPPQPGQTEEDFGNPDLTYESATHYAAGAEWQPAEHLELDTTLFYRDKRDIVVETGAETIDDDGNRRPLVYDNAGQGRAYGWELLLRHYPRGRFFGWLSYTLSRSERLNRDTGEWQLFGIDQTHILTAVAGLELPWNFDVSGRFRLVSGDPQTPIVGSAFDADEDTYRPRRGETNSTRAAPFHQLDLRVNREFVFDTWRMSAYLDVSNVYNATNEEGRQYNYDYTESAPVRATPILPTVGVTARF